MKEYINKYVLSAVLFKGSASITLHAVVLVIFQNTFSSYCFSKTVIKSSAIQCCCGVIRLYLCRTVLLLTGEREKDIKAVNLSSWEISLSFILMKAWKKSVKRHPVPTVVNKCRRCVSFQSLFPCKNTKNEGFSEFSNLASVPCSLTNVFYSRGEQNASSSGEVFCAHIVMALQYSFAGEVQWPSG